MQVNRGTFLALVISVLCNATLLLTTKEYADWSTRSKSTLTIDTEGNIKKLLRDYQKITSLNIAME